MERFTIKQYNTNERPIIKGFGFDGLSLGDEREEAEEFISFINIILDKSDLSDLLSKSFKNLYYFWDFEFNSVSNEATIGEVLKAYKTELNK